MDIRDVLTKVDKTKNLETYHLCENGRNCSGKGDLSYSMTFHQLSERELPQGTTEFKCDGDEGSVPAHPHLHFCHMVNQRFAKVINNREHTPEEMDANAEEKYFM